ncbi:hypothetical protein H5410_043897 [Solanum commersonii]|uniref:Uncharacterized protein n=1 Tax=Solanum commersonii TaxID=4109 RepID=A0A9J5Y0L6_SOLCO|nr:hypothetical protein H5410_043897 [Solanum commersonii]
MPYPYGRKWNGAKEFTVMNIKNTHFIALEFLMEKGLIQVYDCNILMCDEPTFLTLIQPILELWPKLLKQSGMFNHLCEFLNDACSMSYFVFLLSTTLIVSTIASIVPVSASVVRTTGSIVPTTTLVVRTTGSIVFTTSLVVHKLV